MFKYNGLKRMFDLCGALLFLILLSPLIIVIAVILFCVNQGNVFFIQERVGLKERTFRLVKFRSMRELYDRSGNLLADNERIFPLGMFLRNSSLDELPQLLNILKGDLSWVGPRPLLVKYLPYYNETEKLRHTVKPGLTGWAQINGRNALDWDRRLQLDVWYVNNRSTLLDLRIILLTVKKVFSGDGVRASADQVSPVPLDEVRQKQNQPLTHDP